jgi:transcription antitermination factor NusG
MSGNGSAPSEPPWILAIAQPQLELVVMRARRAKRGRVVDIVVPAFSRYVFARVPNERWGEFFDQVEGVVGYVRNGDGGPAHVEPQVIADLLARAVDGFLPPPETPCPFRAGERVIVRGGGLIAGYYGVFQHALDDRHAVIEQEWLGRMVPVTVRIDDLEHVDRRHAKRRHHRSRRRPHRRERQAAAAQETQAVRGA